MMRLLACLVLLLSIPAGLARAQTPAPAEPAPLPDLAPDLPPAPRPDPPALPELIDEEPPVEAPEDLSAASPDPAMPSDPEAPDALTPPDAPNSNSGPVQAADEAAAPIVSRPPPSRRVVNGYTVGEGGAPWMAQLYDANPFTCGYLQESRTAGKERAAYAARARFSTAQRCLEPGAPAGEVLKAEETWQFSHKCGAAYIGQGWVLTAAHCFGYRVNAVTVLYGRRPGSPQSIEDEAYLFRYFRVKLGTQTLFEGGRSFAVDKVILHAGFRRSMADNKSSDIALLHLAGAPAIAAMPKVRAIRLAPPGIERALQPRGLRVTGWGSSTQRNQGDLAPVVEELKPRLQGLDLQLVDTCNEKAPDPRAADYYRKARQPPASFCAIGLQKNGKPADTCQGDSGGPVTLRHKLGTPTQTPNGKGGSWFLYGVVSRGPGCAMRNTGGIYTRVADFKGWIERAIAAKVALNRVTELP